jgi:chromosome segregation protein
VLQFNRLRLTGFKSFVEPTELVIDSGMTGIVGPNGCGKSNLVEALRWVMGESSAKQMRGGEMDDVIFSGTATRPARNVGEVLLSLDNSARSAPAAFNDFEDLDISRRIERGSGSTYRVNGSEVRARDVQLLFADSATGARSTALVSQGRIGAVIAAKPVQRRSLLEEAAGITGLHSRRHEAELRLRGAETNLTRLDDIVVTLEAQLQSLRKQVRQATRYRNISGHIRKAESTLFLLRWRTAQLALQEARAQQEAAEREVGEWTAKAAAASTRQGEAASGLPPLRQTEAEAAAALHRLVVERDGLEAESQRIEAARRSLVERLAQVANDSERERTLAAEATAAAGRLGEEGAEIEAARDGEGDAATEAAERLAETTAEAKRLEADLDERLRQAAAAEARRNALERRIEELADRRRRLEARAAEIEDQRRLAGADAVDPAQRLAADEALEAARLRLEDGRTTAEAAENLRVETTDTTAKAVAALHQVEAGRAQLRAEERALNEILTAGESDLWPPLVDAVTVEPGYEAAVGAALGDDLGVPADEAAPVHWRTLSPGAGAPSLPNGAEPLTRYVDGPPALARRLAQIGVVADAETGARLATSLAQGQRLVSRDGALWRWDGFTITAGAVTAAAARLEQRNRLDTLAGEIAVATGHVDTARAASEARQADAEAAVEGERQARENLRQADADYAAARDVLAEIKEAMARHASQVAALADAVAAVATDLKDNETGTAESVNALAEAPDPDLDGAETVARRAALVEVRNRQVDIQSTVNSMARESDIRRRRLNEIAAERDTWTERNAGARRRLEELEGRRREIEVETTNLADRPDEIDGRRKALLSAVEEAETRRRAAADNLAKAESTLAEAEVDQRAAETDLARRREDRVRAEGAFEQATQACISIRERVSERLECGIDELAGEAGLGDDDPMPEEDAVEKRVERLIRERDTMGPVNLRAEHEASELTEQMETLSGERDDLVQAIDKLRQGISQLNREGRSRLLASFAEVDKHFQELFVRLFGGGRAHLALTESDDPLEAGLEIMASPPGKRLQVLSLLSGGEQALTALALLFAVFLTNPAPICVLDEVDAPLDDANVDRFCSMVDEMAQSGATRFLIITHHRMTMARMDRLFGVTMSERGVSQLVSVDLQQAERLKATA